VADDDASKLRRYAQVGQVFSPAAPIDQYRLFAGRTQQVRDVVSAVIQRGMHVILFGERGVGKTSLANVLGEVLLDLGDEVQSLNSSTVNCDASDTFTTIWRKVGRELEVFTQDPEGMIERGTFADWIGDDPVPDDIRYALDRIPHPVMIVIDEIDRITDLRTTTLMADTIKTLSDHSVDATVVLVGVADSVDQLIAEHLSVERALRQVRMPRMSQAELVEVLDKGLGELQMTIETEARDRIARLSEGLPTYTHLMALEATQRAVLDDRFEVRGADVEAAIRAAVNDSQQSIRSLYHTATHSPRKDNLFGRVLLACALAPTDFMGWFTAGDVREPMTEIMGKEYDIPAFSRHLNDFTRKRGPVLQQSGDPRRYRYRFINPMMQPFVILHGLAMGIVSENLVTGLQAAQGKRLN
jgi:Cdc6-like AAA superfamily ATPase